MPLPLVFYMGAMTGPATNGGKNKTAQVKGSTLRVPAKPRSNQWGTRVFMGYKVNPYGAVEGGFTYYSDVDFNTGNFQTCTSANDRVRAFDLVGKGSLPVSAFELFFKAGAAAIYETTSGSLNSATKTGGCGNSKNVVKYHPTLSVGAGYDLSQSWVADVSWNRLIVGGAVNYMDFFALGISYHFVNKYCGQFLCDD